VLSVAGLLASDGASLLTVDEVLRGMDASDRRFNGLQGWEVRYTHVRDYKSFPAGYDPKTKQTSLDLVNAKSGSKLLLKKIEPSTKATQLYIWRDSVSFEDSGGHITIIPDFSTQFIQHFKFTDNMFIDIYREYKIRAPIVGEVFGTMSPSEAHFEMLPREVRYDRSEYQIRAAREVVNGHECYVLEWPGKDVIWVDGTRGFVVVKRVRYQADGVPSYTVENSDFREPAPGLWVPTKQKRVLYNDINTSYIGGKIFRVETNTVKAIKIGALPDSYFSPTDVQRVTVDDQVRGFSYRVSPRESDPFAEAIDRLKLVHDRELRNQKSRDVFVRGLLCAVICVNLMALAAQYRRRQRSYEVRA
jgi:hypothetical protein